MKYLKIIGAILLGLIVIFLLLGLIFPRHVTLSRSAEIAAPQETVFGLVNDLSHWESWTAWHQQDTTMKITLGNPHAGQGGSYTWESETMGNGELTISDVYGMDSLRTFMDFGEGSTANAIFYFAPTDSGTRVTWKFDADFPYPFNGLLPLMGFEEQITSDYDTGLANLKAMAEEMPAPTVELVVEPIEFPTTRYLVSRAEVPMSEMSEHFQTVLPKMAVDFAQNGVEMLGDPVGLYFTWDEANQVSDMAIGLPTAGSLVTLTEHTIEASSALMVQYIGDYNGTGAAHEALDAYMTENNLTMHGPAIERYRGNPGPDSHPTDPSQWMTEVIYLVQ